MSPRAIDTATGQAHERRGRHLLEAFASRMQCTFVPTPPTVTAPVDGIFVRRGTPWNIGPPYWMPAGSKPRRYLAASPHLTRRTHDYQTT